MSLQKQSESFYCLYSVKNDVKTEREENQEIEHFIASVAYFIAKTYETFQDVGRVILRLATSLFTSCHLLPDCIYLNVGVSTYDY
ncbi:hypothetical protein BBM45_06740 [Vibrio parahaemolyticus]|nr:hypothetical protein ACX13_19330 [Vibrio parahaemolyticus]ODW85506.1 hypothetical protein BBM89_05200 [Vibrio parahaemolyticus]ODZ77812.1 hypothetical protein BBM45_06740 [Vibrio parahaemolyticus]